MSYQLVFILCFITLIFSMKFIAIKLYPSANILTSDFMFKTPVISPFSLRHLAIKNRDVSLHVVKNLIIHTLLVLISYFIYDSAFEYFNTTFLMKQYFLGIFVYLLTEQIGSIARCLSLLGNKIPKPIHNHPYVSKNITEFWGKRWNRWVRDWLMIFSLRLPTKNKAVSVLLVFIVSGLFHEFMFNLPFFLYSGQMLFGTMMLYFFIQAIGIYLDKTVLSKQIVQVRWTFMWIMIIAPIPLFINLPFINFFGF